MDEFLKIIAGSATVGAIVIYLGRLIITKGFDVALNNFQNRLDIIKIEHQIKYSKLHEERATLLKDLYKELYELEIRLNDLTSAFQGPEWPDDNSRRDRAMEQFFKCQNFLEINRIYFSEKFCDELNKNLLECRKVINEMERAKSKGKIENIDAKNNRPMRHKNGETSLDVWLEQERKVKTEIKDRRIQLAKSFKEIIGVNEEKS